MENWQDIFVSVLTILALVTLISSRLRPHWVMMVVLVLLMLSGVLTTAEALSGLANEGMITVAVMFIAAAGIQTTGGVTLLVNALMGAPKTIPGALARVFLPVATLSAFLNNTPVVATMIPAIMQWSRRIGVAPSKLLIPLSYSAILGGTITLIGTSTNLVVNGLYKELTHSEGFALFDLAVVGIPVALGGFVIMLVCFNRLLPDTSAQTPFADIHDFTAEVQVTPEGPVAGKTAEEAGLRHLRSMYLVAISRQRHSLPVTPDTLLEGGDILVFAGQTSAISGLLTFKGLQSVQQASDQAALDNTLIQVVISAGCDVIGKTVTQANFRRRYGAAIVAIARHGYRIDGPLSTVVLAAGDTLLLKARPAFAERQQHNQDFLVITPLADTLPNPAKAYLAWGLLAVGVTAAGFGIISMLHAALAVAAIMLLTGCLSTRQAEQSVDFSVIMTIAASFALGLALQKTGVAQYLADNMLSVSGNNPILLLIATYIAVSLLTEVITNNAAALMMLPVVIAFTEAAQLNPVPFTFAIMMAASASFATPLGYQTNLMVYGPGNYRFTDFLKVGVLMNLLIGALTLTLLVWQFDLRA